MIKKIKQLIQENRIEHKKTRTLLQEQAWANVYHDSIRGYDYLEKLPLNIGRWAGGYAFFYVLNRILHDYKPKSILEFGLGESSKFISTCIAHYLQGSIYHIIEQDQNWLETFHDHYKLHPNTRVSVCPLVLKTIKGFESKCYKDFSKVVSKPYELYVIDGPYGSERYSRYDVIEAISHLTAVNDFIILFDDCDRIGEQDTLSDVLAYFKNKEIKVHHALYQGQKNLAVVGSSKYPFITTM